MEALNKPFISEAYDRLMEAQEQFRRDRVPNSTEYLAEPVTDLRAACERMGVSQAHLADALGLDAPRVSAMVNGKPIDKRTDLATRALLALHSLKQEK